MSSASLISGVVLSVVYGVTGAAAATIVTGLSATCGYLWFERRLRRTQRPARTPRRRAGAEVAEATPEPDVAIVGAP